jgi:hypothetical protein
MLPGLPIRPWPPPGVDHRIRDLGAGSGVTVTSPTIIDSGPALISAVVPVAFAGSVEVCDHRRNRDRRPSGHQPGRP